MKIVAKAHRATILRRARAYVKYELDRIADVRIVKFSPPMALVGCCARDGQASFKMKLWHDRGVGWLVTCDDY